MFKKILHFIQYNNLMIVVIALFFLLGAGVFAQTENGQELIGQKVTREEGVDNTLLLSADLDGMNMDFKIEKIESDEENYYVTYTYLDLLKKDNVWQYELVEKVRKVSKRLRGDLGEYLGGEFKQQYEDRLGVLRSEKLKAEASGVEVKKEVTKYSGLIGKVLDIAGETFPGYEPAEIKEIPSPTISPLILQNVISTPTEVGDVTVGDNLKQVYDDYMLKINSEVNDLPISDVIENVATSTVDEVAPDTTPISDTSIINEVEIISLPSLDEALVASSTDVN